MQLPNPPSLFPNGEPPEVPNSKWLKRVLAGTLTIDLLSYLYDKYNTLTDFIANYNNSMQYTQGQNSTSTTKPANGSNGGAAQAGSRGGTVLVPGSNIPRSTDPTSFYNGAPVYYWGFCAK
jgi:hypothetical protein